MLSFKAADGGNKKTHGKLWKQVCVQLVSLDLSHGCSFLALKEET